MKDCRRWSVAENRPSRANLLEKLGALVNDAELARAACRQLGNEGHRRHKLLSVIGCLSCRQFCLRSTVHWVERRSAVLRFLACGWVACCNAPAAWPECCWDGSGGLSIGGAEVALAHPINFDDRKPADSAAGGC